MKLNKADKKILKIISEFLAKGYSFGEIHAILSGNNILESLLNKINRQLKLIPKDISKYYTFTKNKDFLKTFIEKDKEKIGIILIFKINSIITQYKKRKHLSSRDYKNIENFEYDIIEIREIFNNNSFKTIISEEDKEFSVLYKALKDY